MWASGLVWIGAENLAPTGIRSQDRPAEFNNRIDIYHFAASEKLNFQSGKKLRNLRNHKKAIISEMKPKKKDRWSSKISKDTCKNI